MVINSSQVLISELEFRSHSGDLAPLLYYYKQKPCTLQGRKIDNSLTNICRWCTEMCVFWPKAAALPCFPAEHSANAVIHSPYELLVPLIPLKNCFHTSIAARLILPENILLSEDYSTLLFQRILWSLPPIHPENPESTPTYSWISDNFSVTQQVTCFLKCDLLGHILASEAISAKGEKRKFWLLFRLKCLSQCCPSPHLCYIVQFHHLFRQIGAQAKAADAFNTDAAPIRMDANKAFQCSLLDHHNILHTALLPAGCHQMCSPCNFRRNDCFMVFRNIGRAAIPIILCKMCESSLFSRSFTHFGSFRGKRMAPERKLRCLYIFSLRFYLKVASDRYFPEVWMFFVSCFDFYCIVHSYTITHGHIMRYKYFMYNIPTISHPLTASFIRWRKSYKNFNNNLFPFCILYNLRFWVMHLFQKWFWICISPFINCLIWITSRPHISQHFFRLGG